MAPLHPSRRMPKGPLQLAVYFGTKLALVLGVWAASSVVVLTIMHNRQTREQYMYWFLLNLSGSTVLSGFIYTITMGVLLKDFLDTGSFVITNPDVCLVANVLISSHRCVVCCSVFLMAFERYITIRKPLTHCYILTRKRISLSIAGTWLVAFSFSTGLFVHRLVYESPPKISFCDSELFQVWRVNAAQTCFSMTLYLCVLVIFIHLQVIARRHLRVIEEERRAFGLMQYQRSVRRSNVALRITLFLLAVDVPIYCTNVFRWFNLLGNRAQYTRAISLLIVVSQMCQPLFYSLLSPDFRRNLRSLFRRNRVVPEGHAGLQVAPELPRNQILPQVVGVGVGGTGDTSF